VQRITDLQEAVQEVTELLSNPDVVQQLKQDKMENIEFLKQHHGVRTIRSCLLCLHN
jgi:membrane protein insertase Oxa1/YidC/SpoIIIJ